VLAITADSKVWVSAFTFRGKPRRLIEMADAGEIRIDISEPIMREVLRVLRLKFAWTPGALQEAELQMNAIAHEVTPMQAVDVVKDDPIDNRISECAVEARSDCVVTGDKDLLRLGQHESIRILNASELLDLVHDQGRTS
jgi:putative PIN family toxin of toxin-antitoxin system